MLATAALQRPRPAVAKCGPECFHEVSEDVAALAVWRVDALTRSTARRQYALFRQTPLAKGSSTRWCAVSMLTAWWACAVWVKVARVLGMGKL